MPKLRSRREVVARCAAVTALVRGALAQLPERADDPAVVDAVWQGEGLGVLLWALGRLGLPPYDLAFDHDRLLAASRAQLALRSRRVVGRRADAHLSAARGAPCDAPLAAGRLLRGYRVDAAHELQQAVLREEHRTLAGLEVVDRADRAVALAHEGARVVGERDRLVVCAHQRERA